MHAAAGQGWWPLLVPKHAPARSSPTHPKGVGGHPRQGRQVYHPACAPATTKQRRQGRSPGRWEALPVEERRDSLAVARAYVEEHQETTRERATQRHVKWTADADAVLIARPDAPVHILAAELG